MRSLDELKAVFAKEKDEIFHDYFTFLRFKSLSADPVFKNDLFACAEWLIKYLNKLPLKVEKWESEDGAPVIFAESEFNPKHETVLLYCHYDVQPVDPIELWTTPPFEPQIREGKVYARGASDNKGQCFYTIRALKTFLEKKPSLNVKFIIEGEEESGSHTLSKILNEKKDRLKADHILIVDSGIHKIDRPAITLGARGLVTMTVTITGSNIDMHSGSYGGAVYNPNRALVELLAMTHDKNNKVAIPHFYDDIVLPSDDEKKHFDLDFDASDFEKNIGAKALGIEKGFTPGEAISLRPTLEINGIAGGYGGSGFKTVIPAQAIAKVSCRLVPNQNPDKIGKLVKQFFIDHAPKGLKIDVEIHPGNGEAVRTSPHSKIAKVMRQAYMDIFKKECDGIVLGGSIPISKELQKIATGDLLLIGVSLPSDRIHSPDEHFHLKCFELGYQVIYHGLDVLSHSD